MTPITVVLAFDANFSLHAGVALYSLFAGNPGRPFHVVLLCSDLPDEAAEKFSGLCATFGARLDIRAVDAGMWRALKTHERITRATYFRFLIPRLFDASVARVLYLDCDLVVDGEIGPLWEMDLSGAVLAACRDIGSQQTRHGPLGLSASHHYFNAGVLLIDLAAWRRERVSRRAVEYLQTHREEAIYMDQDALNVCLQDRVKYLGCIWNFMPFLNFTRFQDDFPAIEAGRLRPVIVHFAGGAKPWEMPRDANPWTRLYWEFRDRSPWCLK